VIPTWRHEYRFPEKAVHKIRLVQTARSETESWSIAELRVLHAGVELPRVPAWRLQAWPNPWEVQLAFDNNPVTRWTSAQAYAPGMYLQVDFGAPEAIDQVMVECGQDQGHMQMRLEGETARWQTLAASAYIHDVPPMPRLRRAAIETLKSNGIHWLLVGDRDHGAQDFRERSAQWGITPVDGDQHYQLYRLD